MAGPSIDHMVSLTIFIAALLLFISLFAQSLQTAILYQRNRQVTMKANDLLDSILLNPGNPNNWGQRNVTPTGFGLQNPATGGYVLSPFSLMRLQSSSGQSVYYSKTGLWYSNVTMASGGYLLVPMGDCINYTTVSKLLGTSSSYGFQLTLTPILTVSVSEFRENRLQLRVEVYGQGSPLSNAYLEYNLVHAASGEGSYPAFEILSGSARTDAAGVAILDFPTIDGSKNAYAFIVNAHLGGLFGVGYSEHITAEHRFVIPFVESFEEGKILLAHSYDIHYFGPPNDALHYNATFLVLSANFEFHPVQVGNGTVTGLVNYGVGQPYGEVQIPTSDPGILVVTYRYGNNYGISLLPWGIGSLGVSLKFGADPSGKDWVSTDLRQVMVAEVSYQVKIAVWSLEGFQFWKPVWRW
jgi:hypothetical protein